MPIPYRSKGIFSVFANILISYSVNKNESVREAYADSILSIATVLSNYWNMLNSGRRSIAQGQLLEMRR